MVSLIDVPPLRFLMLDGSGESAEASEPFSASVEALLTLAHQVKFAARKHLYVAYSVMPLEVLYRDEPATWRLMIVIPDEVTSELVDDVRERIMHRKGMPRMADARVQTFSEGMSVQIMHLGPYDEVPSTVEKLIEFAARQRLTVVGPHHRIRLSDPKRVAPEKLKTIIRYGVTRK